MVMLRIDNAMTGGVRCKKCSAVDSYTVLATEIRWQPVIRVFTFCKCVKCAYRETFSYEPETCLKYDHETNSYRFERIAKRR